MMFYCVYSVLLEKPTGEPKYDSTAGFLLLQCSKQHFIDL